MILLLPVDGSAASARAVEFVSGYQGDRSKTAAVLLKVQSVPKQVAQELETGREIFMRNGLAAETVVRVGYPPDEIMEEARQRNVGAIVMGTRGRGVLGGFALGSVALRVAHGSEFPVVLVKPESRLPATLGKQARVIIPVDGSSESDAAVPHLIAWAGWLGSLRVEILHFQDSITLLEAIAPPHGDVLEQWGAGKVEAVLARARDALAAAGIEHATHILAGDPASGIAQFARDHPVDLVAMSTRGLGAAHHALLGSVALKTALLSPVPVAFMR